MEGFEGPMALTIPRGIHSFTYGNDRPKFGMAVEDYADGDGVKVTSVDTASSAEKAGLRKDDIITAVNGEEVKNLDQLRSELNKARQASSIELKVLRAGKTETLTLRVPKKIKTADL
jgi:serine protease Do